MIFADSSARGLGLSRHHSAPWVSAITLMSEHAGSALHRRQWSPRREEKVALLAMRMVDHGPERNMSVQDRVTRKLVS